MVLVVLVGVFDFGRLRGVYRFLFVVVVVFFILTAIFHFTTINDIAR